MLGRLGKKKRLHLQAERVALQNRLAAGGQWDTTINRSNFANARNIDENYKFINNSLMGRFARYFFCGLFFVFGRVVIYFAHGARIKGRENLREIPRGQGAFSVSNHVLYLDNLFLRVGLKPKKVLFTCAAFNIKKGVAGSVLRAGGALPLPASINAYKNLLATIEQELERGRVVHFYAEEAMWNYYEGVRPLKKGAFSLAARFAKPVIPTFITFHDGSWLWRLFRVEKRATIHILKPILPDENLSVKENAERLQRECERVFGELGGAKYE